MVWYKINNFLLKISKGKYVSMWDYFISTNQEKVTYFDDEGNVNYYSDDLNILTITFNARFIGNSSYTDIKVKTI